MHRLMVWLTEHGLVSRPLNSADGAMIWPGETQYNLRPGVAFEFIQEEANATDSRHPLFLSGPHPSPNVVLGYV